MNSSVVSNDEVELLYLKIANLLVENKTLKAESQQVGNNAPRKDFIMMFDIMKRLEEKIEAFNSKVQYLLESLLRNNEEFNRNITLVLAKGQEQVKFQSDLEYELLKEDVSKTNANLDEIKSNLDILLTTNQNINSLDYLFESTQLDICQKKYQGYVCFVYQDEFYIGFGYCAKYLNELYRIRNNKFNCIPLGNRPKPRMNCAYCLQGEYLWLYGGNDQKGCYNHIYRLHLGRLEHYDSVEHDGRLLSNTTGSKMVYCPVADKLYIYGGQYEMVKDLRATFPGSIYEVDPTFLRVAEKRTTVKGRRDHIMQAFTSASSSFAPYFPSRKGKWTGRTDYVLIGFGSNCQGDTNEVLLYAPSLDTAVRVLTQLQLKADDGMSSLELEEGKILVYGGTVEGLRLLINKDDFADVKYDYVDNLRHSNGAVVQLTSQLWDIKNLYSNHLTKINLDLE